MPPCYRVSVWTRSTLPTAACILPCLIVAADLAADHHATLVDADGRWAERRESRPASRTDSKYSLVGTFTAAGAVVPGIPFDFEGLGSRFGWTVGAGVEWAFYKIGRRGWNTTTTISEHKPRR